MTVLMKEKKIKIVLNIIEKGISDQARVVVATNNTTTLDSIAIVRFLHAYSIAVFVLYMSISVNIDDVLLVKRVFLCSDNVSVP